MNGRTRYLTWIAGALAAAAIAVPVAQGHAQPLRRGVSDFGRSPTQVVGQGHATPLRPGIADFGLTWDQVYGASAPTQVEVPTAAGFDWNDAGIGAAAMLGIVLIVGGVGAGLLVTRNHRREFRSA